MYKPSTYLVSSRKLPIFLPTYLPMYDTYIFPTEMVTKVKPNFTFS
jgi:hypothetical protein